MGMGTDIKTLFSPNRKLSAAGESSTLVYKSTEFVDFYSSALEIPPFYFSLLVPRSRWSMPLLCR
jgi:hypothetical protein